MYDQIEINATDINDISLYFDSSLANKIFQGKRILRYSRKE